MSEVGVGVGVEGGNYRGSRKCRWLILVGKQIRGCDDGHGCIHTRGTREMQRLNRGGQIEGGKAENGDLGDQGSGTRDSSVWWMEGSSLSLGLSLTSVMLSGKGCCGWSALSSSFRLASASVSAFHNSLFDSGTDPAPTPLPISAYPGRQSRP